MFKSNNQSKSGITNFLLRVLYFSRNSQAGSTLAVGVGLGLIVLGATAMALANASKEQTNTVGNENAKQAQAVAEGAINATRNEFIKGNNKYLLLADYKDGKWVLDTDKFEKIGSNTPDDTSDDFTPPPNGCGDDGKGNIRLVNNAESVVQSIVDQNTLVADVEGKTLTNGNYYLKEYEYNPVSETGTLTLGGKYSSNKTEKGKAQYKISFDVKVSPPQTPPSKANAAAIMGKDINAAGMAIFANTAICTEPETSGNCGSNVNLSYCTDGTLSTNEFGDQYDELQKLLGSDKNGFIAPDYKEPTSIIVKTTDIPAIPVAPSGAKIYYVNASNGTESQAPITVSSLNDDSTMVAQVDSDLVSPNQNLFSATFSKFWQWLDAPAYAAKKSGSKKGGGTTIPNPAPTSNDYFALDSKEGTLVNLHKFPADAFVEETIDGQLYHAVYIQAQNFNTSTDFNLVIDETELEKIQVNGKNLDSERMLVRVYVNESLTSTGNHAIQVVDPSLKRIDGSTAKERRQIGALRIIGGNADGTPVGNLSWEMKGTVCRMGHIHAPTAEVSLAQGNGCGNSGGETPIDLNDVAQDYYGQGNYNSIPSNVGTPNVFGAIWARKITNQSQGGSSAFYENPELTNVLFSEFGGEYPNINGETALSSVKMGNGINSIVRTNAN